MKPRTIKLAHVTIAYNHAYTGSAQQQRNAVEALAARMHWTVKPMHYDLEHPKGYRFVFIFAVPGKRDVRKRKKKQETS